jgi:hypothetical protein
MIDRTSVHRASHIGLLINRALSGKAQINARLSGDIDPDELDLITQIEIDATDD